MLSQVHSFLMWSSHEWGTTEGTQSCDCEGILLLYLFLAKADLAGHHPEMCGRRIATWSTGFGFRRDRFEAPGITALADGVDPQAPFLVIEDGLCSCSHCGIVRCSRCKAKTVARMTASLRRASQRKCSLSACRTCRRHVLLTAVDYAAGCRETRRIGRSFISVARIFCAGLEEAVRFCICTETVRDMHSSSCPSLAGSTSTRWAKVCGGSTKAFASLDSQEQ